LEPQIEDGVGGVQHGIGGIEQCCELSDERQRTKSEVGLERPRWVRADVERAVHDRPRARGRHGRQHLDTEQRRHHQVRLRRGNQCRDGRRCLLRPPRHPLLHDRSSAPEVAAGRRHCVADGGDEIWPQVMLRSKRVDGDPEAGHGSLDRPVTNEQRLVTPVAKRQRRRQDRLEITAGPSGRDDKDPCHSDSLAGAADRRSRLAPAARIAAASHVRTAVSYAIGHSRRLASLP
jgi:hypothetical protein